MSRVATPLPGSIRTRVDRYGELAVHARPHDLAQKIWYSLSLRGLYALRVPSMLVNLAGEGLRRVGLRLGSRSAVDELLRRSAAELLLNTSACVGLSDVCDAGEDGRQRLLFTFDLAPFLPSDPNEPARHVGALEFTVEFDPQSQETRATRCSYRDASSHIETEAPAEIRNLACGLICYCCHTAVHVNAGRAEPGQSLEKLPWTTFTNIQGLNRAANHWPAHAIGRARSDNRLLLTSALLSRSVWHQRGRPKSLPQSPFFRAAMAAHRCLAEFDVPPRAASQWIAAYVMHDLDHHNFVAATRCPGAGHSTSSHPLRVLREVFIRPPRLAFRPIDESPAQRELRLAVRDAVAQVEPRLARWVGRCWSV